MPDLERRFIGSVIELRAGKSDMPVMAGHAAVFNSRSQNLGGFYEMLMPGCFTAALEDKSLECYSLFNHDPNLVLGVTTNGSLRVSQDKTGLYQETDMTGDTSTSKDVKAHVASGRITRMSFAMKVEPDGDSYSVDKNNDVIRSIHSISLLADTSPVTYAAYDAANVGMRSALGESAYDQLMPLIVRAQHSLPLGKTDFDTLRDWQKRINDLLNLEKPISAPEPVSRRSLAQLKQQFDFL